MSDLLSDTILLLIAFAPINVVGLVGFILALRWLKAHRKPKLLITIGAGCIPVSTLIFIVRINYMSEIRSVAAPYMQPYLLAAGLVLWSGTLAVGIGLFMWAAYTGRKPLLNIDED